MTTRGTVSRQSPPCCWPYCSWSHWFRARRECRMDVRTRIAQNDFAGAAAQIQNYRRSRGRYSGCAGGHELDGSRGVGAARIWIRRRSGPRIRISSPRRKWKKHPLSRDPNAPLALALGAAIEVEGEVMAARGERAGAVAYLPRRASRNITATSIHARIQKVINQLSLEGKPAPALVGITIPKGKPALVFFWAHWCPDCKAEAADLVQVEERVCSEGAGVPRADSEVWLCRGRRRCDAGGGDALHRASAPDVTTPA